MAPRAVWKGHLKLGQISCAVLLCKAMGEPECVSFTQINRATGNRIKHLRVDAVTGEIVEPADIAKGFEVATGRYVEVTDEEIAAAAPRSAQILEIDSFASPTELAPELAEEHYFVAPDGLLAAEAFFLLRHALEASGLVALAPIAMGTLERMAAISPCGPVMILTKLRRIDEMRDPLACLCELEPSFVDSNLLRITRKAIAGRRKAFSFDHMDRYQAALVKLVQDKIAGRVTRLPATAKPPRMTDLTEAVRKTAGTAPRRPKARKSG